MKILITGICGFVGSRLARTFVESNDRLLVSGIDNFSRKGSEQNRPTLSALGIEVKHGDIRNRSDLDAVRGADWVIDCAAEPSVLAGTAGQASSRLLVEHNLLGTLNILEFCKQHASGLIMLSTSRVYSIEQLRSIPLVVGDHAFRLGTDQNMWLQGLGPDGLTESFSTQQPVSLYGATKLASETMALEYAHAFGFPLWINRCGVLAGAGQLGRADQGIFSYWIHSYHARQPLRYIGFEGTGHQVRDCLHPEDLARLVEKQMENQVAANCDGPPRIVNVSGGQASACSLSQLTGWCQHRFGMHRVLAGRETRANDVPWVVLDAGVASSSWDWQPKYRLEDILEEIAQHAEQRPDWLSLCC